MVGIGFINLVQLKPQTTIFWTGFGSLDFPEARKQLSHFTVSTELSGQTYQIPKKPTSVKTTLESGSVTKPLTFSSSDVCILGMDSGPHFGYKKKIFGYKLVVN